MSGALPQTANERRASENDTACNRAGLDRHLGRSSRSDLVSEYAIWHRHRGNVENLDGIAHSVRRGWRELHKEMTGAAGLDSNDDLKLEFWPPSLLPSMFIKYWFDEDGILHQRGIEEDEWRRP